MHVPVVKKITTENGSKTSGTFGVPKGAGQTQFSRQIFSRGWGETGKQIGNSPDANRDLVQRLGPHERGKERRVVDEEEVVVLGYVEFDDVGHEGWDEVGGVNALEVHDCDACQNGNGKRDC